MPALLGYLFAIAIFLGGGYAGVAWLASPESPSAYHGPSYKATSHRKNAQQKNPSATQVPEGGGSSAIVDRTSKSAATAAVPDGATLQDTNVAADDAKIANFDSVPSGGCTPIGLTAQGDMVFPLRCRELLEQRSGPASSAAMAPPLKENEGPASTKPTGSSDTQIGSDMRKPSERKAPAQTRAEEYASRPTSAPSSEPVTTRVRANENASPSELSASLNEPEHNDASTTGAMKPDVQGAKAGVGLSKHSTESLVQRSRLVKMTLRTIEYSDGHRERRLLPIKHAQRATLESEDQWYNPLGLR